MDQVDILKQLFDEFSLKVQEYIEKENKKLDEKQEKIALEKKDKLLLDQKEEELKQKEANLIKREEILQQNIQLNRERTESIEKKEKKIEEEKIRVQQLMNTL